jgi:hypothetical protein
LGPPELQTRQPELGFRFVPRLEGGVFVEFRIGDDLIAEAVNDRGDGEDAAQPIIEARLLGDGGRVVRLRLGAGATGDAGANQPDCAR